MGAILLRKTSALFLATMQALIRHLWQDMLSFQITFFGNVVGFTDVLEFVQIKLNRMKGLNK